MKLKNQELIDCVCLLLKSVCLINIHCIIFKLIFSVFGFLFIFLSLSICLNEMLMLTRTSAACYLCKLVSVFRSK